MINKMLSRKIKDAARRFLKVYVSVMLVTGVVAAAVAGFTDETLIDDARPTAWYAAILAFFAVAALVYADILAGNLRKLALFATVAMGCSAYLMMADEAGVRPDDTGLAIGLGILLAIDAVLSLMLMPILWLCRRIWSDVRNKRGFAVAAVALSLVLVIIAALESRRYFPLHQFLPDVPLFYPLAFLGFLLAAVYVWDFVRKKRKPQVAAPPERSNGCPGDYKLGWGMEE